ncbi:MAG: OmpA family protein [Flavobacteriales bacterium]
MKKTLLSLFVIALASMANAQTNPPSDAVLPPNGESGKCYVKCITPDVWSNETVQVMTRPAYTKLKVIPAVYETVTETYTERPAYTKYKVIPAKFTYETVSYTSKEARTDIKVIPAKFGRSSETVETKPAYANWEYSTYPNCKSNDPGDCRYVCWKEYPAKSTKVPTKTVTDATTSNVPVRAQTSSYKKRLVTPSRVEEIQVPAVTKTYTWRKLVTPARTEKITVPAQYKTVTKTVLTKKGGVTVWEEVECGKLSGEILPIYYNLGSAALTSSSKRVIDTKLLAYMRANPNKVIEISSHTDSRGDDASNMDLSQRRAQSVVDYLISKGINSSRLISKGYGETNLTNNCSNGQSCTEAQHRKNRRTEFRVVGGQ